MMQPSEYPEIPLNKLKIDISTGYIYFCDKEHPLATGNAYRVLYHRHIISIKYNRWISTEEIVHHLDEDKLNNSPENLEILSRKEHRLQHTKDRIVEKICSMCGKVYHNYEYRNKFCSQKCVSLSQVKNKNLTKEILDELIPTHTWVELGKIFGYSDTGIKKRAKRLGCNV